VNIFNLEVRVGLQDLFMGHPVSHHSHDGSHRNAESTDTGQATHFVFLNGYAEIGRSVLRVQIYVFRDTDANLPSIIPTAITKTAHWRMDDDVRQGIALFRASPILHPPST